VQVPSVIDVRGWLSRRQMNFHLNSEIKGAPTPFSRPVLLRNRLASLSFEPRKLPSLVPSIEQWQKEEWNSQLSRPFPRGTNVITLLPTPAYSLLPRKSLCSRLSRREVDIVASKQ